MAKSFCVTQSCDCSHLAKSHIIMYIRSAFYILTSVSPRKMKFLYLDVHISTRKNYSDMGNKSFMILVGSPPPKDYFITWHKKYRNILMSFFSATNITAVVRSRDSFKVKLREQVLRPKSLNPQIHQYVNGLSVRH